MLLFAQLAACDAPLSGAYELTLADPVTACPAGEAPVAPRRVRVQLDGSDASVLVFPLDEACPLVGERFVCDAWDLVADYTAFSIDAVVTRDLGFSGAWVPGEPVAGDLSWEVTCEGADCGVIDAPTPCSTAWAWTGAVTVAGGERVRCGWSVPEVGSAEALGVAPWDPVRMELEDGEASRRTLLAEGSPFTLEPYVVSGLVDAEANLYAPPEEHPGEKLVIAGAWISPARVGWTAEFCPEAPAFLEDGIAWTVGRYGRDPTFSPDLALGSWDLRPGTTLASGHDAWVGGVAATYTEGTRLEVLAVDGDAAEIRLVTRIQGTESECVLLHDQAQLSATGELTWSRDRIEAATDPDPLVLYAPRLRLGFDGGGADAAGGEFSATIDVRATEGTDYDVCDWGASFGVDCEPCADDGHPSCVAVAGLAWTAMRSDVPAGQELPLCGADFSDTGVFPEWDLDCGDGSGSLCAGAWIVLLAPLLRRRRP